MSEEDVQRYSRHDGDEISIRQLIGKFKSLWNYLLSRSLLILGLGFAGAGVGLLIGWFSKPVYTATTTFVLEGGESSGSLQQYAGLASMVGLDLGGGTSGGIFQGDNIMELYKSRTMIVKALLSPVEIEGKKQLLVDRYIDMNELREAWAEEPELAALKFAEMPDNRQPAFSRVQDSVLSAVVYDINKNYLEVGKLDKKLSIIRVDVKSKDEPFAKHFNNEIVEKVNDFYIQTKTKKSLENINIMQAKADSVKAIMNNNIYTAASVLDATPNLNVTRQTQRTAPVQRSQYAAETNKAILSELVKNLEISKMALSRERPLIQVVDQPVYPLYKEKFGKLKGLVLGGLLAGMLTVMFLIVKKIIADSN